MVCPYRACIAVLFAVSAASAYAQPALGSPTVTFPFTTMGGKMGTANLTLAMDEVSVSPNWMLLNQRSTFRLEAPNKDLPQGSYTVRFGIKQSSGAGSLQLIGNGVQSTCAFNMQPSYTGPVQYCSLGPIQVAENRLLVVTGSLAGNQPSSWQIRDVTVTKAP